MTWSRCSAIGSLSLSTAVDGFSEVLVDMVENLAMYRSSGRRLEAKMGSRRFVREGTLSFP